MACSFRTIDFRAIRLGVVLALLIAAWCAGPQNVVEAAYRNETAPTMGEGSVLQALTHVTVVDPATGADEQLDMTILIRDSRIVAVQKSTEARLPPGTVIHNEQGRYVIPGLWDVHIHLTQVGPKVFPLLLDNGILSVRDMGSDLIEIRQWQSARVAGAVIPRILTPGPKLDGRSYEESLHAEYRPDRFIVTSPETARATVDVLKKAKVNFIKVQNGMSPGIYEAIAKEAHAAGLPFDGHLPTAGPLAAAAAGQRTLEHGQHMMLCSEADWKKIHTEPPDRAADEETWCATLDVQPKMFPAIVHAVKTLSANLSGSSTVWPELQAWWDVETESATPFTDFEGRLAEKAPAMAAAASKAGVRLLAGTDTGDPYVVPGYALHDEIELMVAAGVPILKALQSATSEPAAAFGLSSTLGAVAVGQSADLLVLDGDPLQDISNTRKISAVVFNGHWLPSGHVQLPGR